MSFQLYDILYILCKCKISNRCRLLYFNIVLNGSVQREFDYLIILCFELLYTHYGSLCVTLLCSILYYTKNKSLVIINFGTFLLTNKVIKSQNKNYWSIRRDVYIVFHISVQMRYTLADMRIGNRKL